MALEPSAAWLAGAITVLVGAVLLIVWSRYLGAGTWEQSIKRQHRWSVHGPLVLLALFAYVTTSSVVIAGAAAGLVQWWLVSTRQVSSAAPTSIPRQTPER